LMPYIFEMLLASRAAGWDSPPYHHCAVSGGHAAGFQYCQGHFFGGD
jgi:hypothetical protein